MGSSRPVSRTPPTSSSTPDAVAADARDRARRRNRTREFSPHPFPSPVVVVTVVVVVVVAPNVPRDVTRARVPVPLGSLRQRCAASPSLPPRAGSRVAGARARAGFRQKDKTFAVARTSGVHALFTMRSSSMIVAFMRARASQDAAAEPKRTPPFVGNDRGSTTIVDVDAIDPGVDVFFVRVCVLSHYMRVFVSSVWDQTSPGLASRVSR